ncbi:kinase-like domain-containing protein [Cadophora sp. MPI-SDFR-AT-0126]|nr:kinase-like domain-containing protein [Leotiomycetes sp. MPI-SDFR-AT-0126]
MHLLINLLITLLPLPLTQATTLTLQLGGQTTSLSSGPSTHDFNQTSLGLSNAGATYPITTCGCTSLEDKQSMCAHIVYDGMPVRFYSSVDCSGPVSWEFDGTGLEGGGVGGAGASYNATFLVPPGLAAPPTTTVAHPVAAIPARRAPRPKPPQFPRRDKSSYRNPGLYAGVTYKPHGAPQGGHQNWRPVKYLGQGGGGAVVLWEYNGPLAAPPIRKIAVKNKQEPAIDWLWEEGQMIQLLNQSGSEHIVRLLVPPHRLTDADRRIEGGSRSLPVAWTGVVRRLIMEYCPQGSLNRLLVERRRRYLPFEELTLWRIFECIVDGLAVLEYDAELVLDPNNPGHFIADPAWYIQGNPVVVHFDLKPENSKFLSHNIVVGTVSEYGLRKAVFGVDDRRAAAGTHPDTQTWKIGDFGLFMEVHRTGFNQPNGTGWIVPPGGTYVANDIRLRRRGTEGYYCPEQFSPRWNYADYQTSSLCAKFGRKTNVWGAGQIMYELACFDPGHPEAYYPFNPSTLTPPHTPFNIGNAPARGITYGTHLRATPYSNELKDMIHECLYEEPSHRPKLRNLKRRITDAIATCLAAGTRPEGWHTLNTPEPRTT